MEETQKDIYQLVEQSTRKCYAIAHIFLRLF